MSKKQYNESETINAINDVCENVETIEPVSESNETVEEESQEEPIYGKVTGCERLNVRSESTKDSDVICVIDSGTEVLVDLDDSTVDWYKVYLEDGIEGFCLAEFIRID